MTASILAALAPIVFVVALGWIAGATKLVPVEGSKTLAAFVVVFALPIALFLAAAKADPSKIFDGPTLLALVVGFSGTYAIGLVLGRLFKHPPRERALQGLACSFPNMAYCGPPVLTAAIGAQALLMVVVGNLISSLILVPLTILLMARGAPAADGTPMGIGAALLRAIRQPLVFLPIAGVVLALLHVELPAIAVSAADQIGKAAGGVALFALGLILSSIPIRLDVEAIVNVAVKNVLQPAIIVGVGYAAGLRGEALAQVFLLGVLPTATEVSAISVARGIYTGQAADTTALSTLFAIVSISVGIAVTALLKAH